MQKNFTTLYDIKNVTKHSTKHCKTVLKLYKLYNLQMKYIKPAATDKQRIAKFD